MKNDPCVRFGIFMRPKMSEKPADSRKSRPPSVMLLMASTSQRLMFGRGPGPVSALQWGIVTRVDGLGEEPLLLVGPELTHLGIRLERGVDELVALLVDPPDVEVPDDVAEVIEAEGAARRVGERDPAEGPDERLPVLGLAAGLLEGRLRDLAVDVQPGGV